MHETSYISAKFPDGHFKFVTLVTGKDFMVLVINVQQLTSCSFCLAVLCSASRGSPTVRLSRAQASPSQVGGGSTFFSQWSNIPRRVWVLVPYKLQGYHTQLEIEPDVKPLVADIQELLPDTAQVIHPQGLGGTRPRVV